MGDGGREDHMKGTTPGGLVRDFFFFSLKSFLKGYIVFSNWGGLWKEILHRGRPRVGCHPLAVLPGDRVPVRIVEKKRGKKEKKEEKGEGIFPYYSDICR